ncbi:MAG: hypothetical protein KatS3mg076_0387 [Candidatus Binatia bacterium]|nr:MAG: hypothetical protein KatS3mg076_0387 [Candidatus Binatia bacterium]
MEEPEIHELAREDFVREVRSFRFWFESVRGYLSFDEEPGAPEHVPSADERERLVTVLCNYCVGETAALEGASGLVALASDHDAKIFLATQAADEARHLEAFLRRLSELGIPEPETEIERRGAPTLLEFRRRLLDFVHTGNWVAAVFAQNVLLESLEFAVFQHHARVADPRTGRILAGIVKDERRHIGFGENEIGRALLSDPSRRALLGRIHLELSPLLQKAVEDCGAAAGLAPRDVEAVRRLYGETLGRLGVTS